jgi:hypothetical protein
MDSTWYSLYLFASGRDSGRHGKACARDMISFLILPFLLDNLVVDSASL